MKKYYFLIVVVLILGLILTGCSLLSNISQVPTTERKPNVIGDSFLSGELVAGKDNNVGTVIVSNDADNLYVQYVITDPTEWCLTETHLAVGVEVDLSDIPQKNENPIPGQFPYQCCYDETEEEWLFVKKPDTLSGTCDAADPNLTDPCLSTITYTIPLSEIDGGVKPEDPLFIAAHAVVKDNYSCYQTAVLYGIERYTGTVYGVDVLTGTSWMEFDIVPPPSTLSATPNGLAYDVWNDRFYYCNYQTVPDNTLYFWDGDQHVAGLLIGDTAAATFYDGKYYYITGPPPSDDLYVVEFGINGFMSGSPVKLADIASDAHGWTFNGDIAIKDGVIYGWGWCGIDNEYEFFTYDLDTGDFNVNTVSSSFSLQIAFGSDGILYGHRSGGAGAFYVVDTTNGDVTMVTPTPSPVNLYTDCASGMICEAVTETAWAANIDFLGKNWATYFIYTIQEPE